jgi:hypothetical protein
MDSVSELHFATGLLFSVYLMGLFCICVTAHIEYENLNVMSTSLMELV